MDVLFDDRMRGAAAVGPQWARRRLPAGVQPAILTRIQPRRHPHERVADGRLQRPAAAISVQGGPADHVLEAHVPGHGTDMEVGLGGVLVSHPDMKVGIVNVLIGRPVSSVPVLWRRLAAAWERGTAGAASGKDRDVPVGAPPQRRRRPAAQAGGATPATQQLSAGGGSVVVIL